MNTSLKKYPTSNRVLWLFWFCVILAALCCILWIVLLESSLGPGELQEYIGILGVISFLGAYLFKLNLPEESVLPNKRYALYGLILLGGIAWMLLNYRLSEIYYFPDTWEYLSVARHPVTSPDLIGALRAPTLPLFAKIFGLSGFQQPTDEFLGAAKTFTQFQSIFSLVATAILGLTVAHMVRRKALKPLALLVVMAFGLNTHISMWNKIVYAESLSTAFFFLFVAALMILNTKRSKNPYENPLTVLTLVLMTLIIVLFVLTRDMNGYLSLLAGLLILGSSLLNYLVHKQLDILRIILSMILLTGFLISNISAQAGQRWLRPNINVLYKRILPDPSALQFYIERGLPYDQNLPIFELEWADFARTVVQDRQALGILSWMQDHGLNTYYRYLLANPVQSLLQPIANADHLLLPDSREYQLVAYEPPDWVPLMDMVIFPTSARFVAIWSLLVVIGFVYWSRRYGWDDRMLVPVILLLTIYPLMFLIYHGDELEIERHALGLAVQLRLGLILFTFFLLDNFAGKFSLQFRRLE